MTQRLAGRVALVTGAARGLGAAIALRLAQDGAHVTLVDLAADVEAAAAALREQGFKAAARMADVSSEAAVKALVDGVAAEQGVLDIVVNNAGISPKRDGRKWFVHEMDLEGWNRVLAVNLTSMFLVCQAAMPHLKRSRCGRVINISSQSARTKPMSTSGHYAASKAGVTGFSRALAVELGPSGVTVNCVAPGVIETEMFKAFTQEQRDAAQKQVPLQRLGQPSDIAAAVSYLASDDGAYLTGTTIDVNGGLFMT